MGSQAQVPRILKLEGCVVVELPAAAFACAALWTLAGPGPCPSLAALPDAMLILLTLEIVSGIVHIGGFARRFARLGPCFQFDV